MLKAGYQSIQYSVEIEIRKMIEVVFNHLVRLDQWWPEEFEGESLRKNSEFTLTTGDGHYSINKIIEFLPNERMAWQTIESLRKSDAFDWTGTKFIFDLTPTVHATKVKFTYDGIILRYDSEKLKQICDITLKELFYNYITKDER